MFIFSITFLEIFGSASVAVSQTTDVKYLDSKINIDGSDFLLNHDNIFTYGLSCLKQEKNGIITRSDDIGNAKLKIKTITINSHSGKPLITINIGQKTSVFDLLIPVSHNYVAMTMNKPFYSDLSHSLIIKISLIVALIASVLVSIFIYLKTHLQFSAQINFISDKNQYSMRKIFAYCLIIFAISKLIFFGEYWFLANYAGFAGDFAYNMYNADVGFYRQIINNGYALSVVGGEQANWAFFPMFPMLVKTLMFAGLPEISGIYLNQILLFATMIILFMYIQENYNLRIAKFAILFLSLGSENVYFMTLYSEANFLFLSVLSIYLLSKDKLFWSSVCCGFLSASRFIGFVMVLPIVLKSIKQNSIFKTILLCLISISGLLLFMLYLHFHVNDALAFYRIQDAWRHTLELSWIQNPLWTFYMTLVRSNLIDKLLFVLSFFILATFYKYKKYNECILFGMLMLATFSSKSLGSYTRFFFASFPVYIYLGIYAATRYGRMLTITALMLFMHFLYLVFWLERSGSAW